MIRAAVAALVLVATPAAAQTDPLFPEAECAALWAATAAFRAHYAIDSAAPGAARQLARDFRRRAIAKSGGDAAAVDRHIREATPPLLGLLEAYILDGDRDSRDTYEWLATLCDDFLKAHGAEH